MQPTLLVLAAGMGSRYGGVKQIDAVGKNAECLLDFASYDALKSGFGKIVFVIRKDIEKDFRERLFDRIARNCDAEYVFQTREALLSDEELKNAAERSKPWGTIHAVLCAEKNIPSAFAVINSDDYYGRDAFLTLSKHLSALNASSTEHAMVGYVLGNTMSKSGSVSRGVCEVKDGFLCSITENTKIAYAEDGKIVSELNGQKIVLTGKEWVSMNLFGFSLSSFESFHSYWENFKKSSISLPKAEALLPAAASEIVHNQKGSIKFYTSTEKWFGMTYPEDREIVKREISSKIDSGYYPERLWEK